MDNQALLDKLTKMPVFKKLSRENIERLIKQDSQYYRIMQNISASVCKKLRSSNETTVRALQEKMELFKSQVTMSRFLIGVILLLTFLSAFNLVAVEVQKNIGTSTYITIPLMTIMLGFLIVIFRITGLSLASCGVTWRGGWRAFWGGLFYTLPFWLVILSL